jgi:dihydrofolate reductase
VSRIVVTEYLTLDGVMEAPNKWSLQFWSDDAAKFKFDELFAADALLLGRVTYEGFSAAWPTMTDEAGFADRMNSLPKYVASTTLKNPTWNASVIKGDVAAEVAALREKPGRDILVAGSADLVDTLARGNLVDEYRIMLHPVIAGEGKRLFKNGLDQTEFDLVHVQQFSTGIVVLTYRPKIAKETQHAEQ